MLIGTRVEPDEFVFGTVGFDVDDFTRGSHDVKVFGLGGADNLRGYWNHYYDEVHGVVFVVDSADAERLGEVSDAFAQVLSERQVDGKPILVFANKQDLPGAMTAAEISQRLGLPGLERSPNHIVQSIALVDREAEDERLRDVDPNILKGLDWILDAVDKNYDALTERIKADMAERAVKEAARLKAQKERVAKYKQERKDQEQRCDQKEQQSDEAASPKQEQPTASAPTGKQPHQQRDINNADDIGVAAAEAERAEAEAEEQAQREEQHAAGAQAVAVNGVGASSVETRRDISAATPGALPVASGANAMHKNSTSKADAYKPSGSTGVSDEADDGGVVNSNNKDNNNVAADHENDPHVNAASTAVDDNTSAAKTADRHRPLPLVTTARDNNDDDSDLITPVVLPSPSPGVEVSVADSQQQPPQQNENGSDQKQAEQVMMASLPGMPMEASPIKHKERNRDEQQQHSGDTFTPLNVPAIKSPQDDNDDKDGGNSTSRSGIGDGNNGHSGSNDLILAPSPLPSMRHGASNNTTV
eukprot:TRINITY_DN66823_c3_g2_i3.p1 TRINITY_DN66823_c3_g2~~TRINITY_DN66823_c3_g2_i3.p1  ORF type:complete len:532 (-),score=234.86 TRINITY_DN66823_c3_g2_i3:35-1630(-)